MKSTKPSPPSVSVKRVVFTLGHARRRPFSIARAAWSEVSVPLNLSGAMSTRRGCGADLDARRLTILVTTRRQAAGNGEFRLGIFHATNPGPCVSWLRHDNARSLREA